MLWVLQVQWVCTCNRSTNHHFPLPTDIIKAIPWGAQKLQPHCNSFLHKVQQRLATAVHFFARCFRFHDRRTGKRHPRSARLPRDQAHTNAMQHPHPAAAECPSSASTHWGFAQHLASLWGLGFCMCTKQWAGFAGKRTVMHPLLCFFLSSARFGSVRRLCRYQAELDETTGCRKNKSLGVSRSELYGSI